MIEIDEKKQELAIIDKTGLSNVYENKEQFDQLSRAANMLSKTSIIPQQYQNKPADCFVALEMSVRMGVSPMMIMQNLYVVKGKPSWAGQACTALIAGCGKFKNVRHVYEGEKGKESRGCYVEAVRTDTEDIVKGPEVTLKMAKDEGWTTNSKWRNMPELMLAYRASSFFARVHCPEALMGMQTAEELSDIRDRKAVMEDVL